MVIYFVIFSNPCYSRTTSKPLPPESAIELTQAETDWLAKHPKIQLASDYAWPPFETIDKKGVYGGIAADYMRLIEHRLGIQFEISPVKPWSEITQMVKSRELDLFSCAMETEQRKAYAYFTKPYISHPMVIVTARNIGYVDGLGGLTGKKVAVEASYASFDLISSNHPDIILKPYPDSLSAMNAVSKGQVFAYIGNIATMGQVVRQNNIDNIKISGEIKYRFELAMGVRSDWPELVPILQKALDSISIQEKNYINEKWINVDIEPTLNYTLIAQVIFFVLLIFVAILYWNRTLKQLVQQRTHQYRNELLKRQNSEERFRGLVESTSDWIWEVNQDTQFTYCSPKITEILGYQPNDVMGKQPFKLMPNDEAKHLEPSIFNIMNTHQPFEGLETIHLHKNGNLINLETSGIPIFDKNNHYLGYRGVARDITSRKKTENLVQQIASVVDANTGEAFFRELVTKLASALNVAYVHIGELTADKQHIQTLSVWLNDDYAPNYQYALAGTPCSDVTRKGQCTFSSKVGAAFPDDEILIEMGFESYSGVPLFTTAQTPLGILVALDTKPLKEPELTESVLKIFAVRAATEMERLHNEGELRQAASVFENTTEGIIIADSNANVLAANNAFFKMSGYSESEVVGKNPRLWKSQHHDECFYQTMWNALNENGRWQGEIWNRRKNGNVFPAWATINVINTHQKLDRYVAVYSDISSIKESQEKLQFLAHHDPLTSLPNRLLFSARLEHAIKHAHRQTSLVAVMFLDLDNFKQINDGLGHVIGDAVLKEVANRVTLQVREDDTVARMGGDEFAVVLENIENSQDASIVATKILNAFGQALEIDKHKLYLTISIGISTYPDDENSVTGLVKNADAAMYRAKEQGKNRYCFYTSDLTDAALEQLKIENHLREAIARNEFELYYQPQYELSTGKLVGAEALLRWIHPEWGVVSPVKFIPIAESTGMIIPLGEWVLREACRQTKTWQEQELNIKRIGVNIAGQQIQHPDFVNVVNDILNETELSPYSLELEITESFIMQQAETSINKLESLRNTGIKFAIDDFGTGYSSLSYLKRLPIDKLKIDRSFIKDIPDDDDDKAITRSIIALGNSLNLQIIAEGVETEEQRIFLKNEGCEEVQGFLYSRPVPKEEFMHLIQLK